MMFVRRKSSRLAMLRSTWDSAAKLITASVSGSSASNTLLASAISPRTNSCRAVSRSSRLSRLPAYVSASKFLTLQERSSSSNTLTKEEPINPAPPVTKNLRLEKVTIVSVAIQYSFDNLGKGTAWKEPGGYSGHHRVSCVQWLKQRHREHDAQPDYQLTAGYRSRLTVLRPFAKLPYQ